MQSLIEKKKKKKKGKEKKGKEKKEKNKKGNLDSQMFKNGQTKC